MGINLTEANRVFLMEPTLNPALEAQAIGRVHRLGQAHPVEITRFIVKNSIEERIISIKKAKFGAKAVGDEEPAGGPGNAIVAAAAGVNLRNLHEDRDEDADIEVIDVRGAGHLHADKTEMKVEEFDRLFGVTPADLLAHQQAYLR